MHVFSGEPARNVESFSHEASPQLKLQKATLKDWGPISKPPRFPQEIANGRSAFRKHKSLKVCLVHFVGGSCQIEVSKGQADKDSVKRLFRIRWMQAKQAKLKGFWI